LSELRLQSRDISVEQSWGLVSWLIETGSNEFTISCLSGSSAKARFCKKVAESLSRFAMEPQLRSRSTRFVHEPPKIETPLWRLNRESLAALRGVMPSGIFTDAQGNTEGWIEDLAVYDHGRIRLGVVTHEDEAILSVDSHEHQQLRDRGLVP
jgi:hypothetical protein